MIPRKSRNCKRPALRVGVLWAGLSVLSLTGCAKRYRVQGMITSMQPEARTIVVSHRAIPGYMEAMEMPFPVKRGEKLPALAPGAQVKFDLAIRNGVAQAERIQLESSSFQPIVQDRGVAVKLPGSAEQVREGDVAPDFELVNQLGQRVKRSDFHGCVVVINFIYTRCPLPEVCPRLAANFALLQRRFREQLGRELILMSITLDPKHDTPEVLEKYGKARGADPRGWHLLTGSECEVRKVADHFGLAYWSEEGFLAHTSLTCMIGRDGRLRARVGGSAYETQQLGDLIARQLEAIR
jgi:protein SCO1/2